MTRSLITTFLLAGSALAQAPPQTTRSTPAPAVAPKPTQDWAQLGRYAADDATLPPPAAGQQRVVFLGDSITDGWGRKPGTSFFPGKSYVNRGISGQTTPQMLVRFEQDVVHLHPEVVVILAGTNDVAGNTGPETPAMIEDNFRAMTDIARRNGIRVVLASITPAARYPWRPGVESVPEIRELNGWLRQYAAQQHLVYLDYYSAMADPDGAMKPGLSSDGVHPTQAGYAVMAPLAEAAIAKALKQETP
jgi:lysophospholipase L1-like esterase